MNKDKENDLAPKLRFPEFFNKKSWSLCKLSDVLFEHNFRSSGKEEVYSVSVNKGLINQIEHLGRSFSAANTDNYKLVNPGDVVYTKSPTGEFPFGIIKQSKIGKSVIVSPLYGVFKPETEFLGSLLDSYFEEPSKVFNYLESIVQKGAKNTINIKNDVFLSKSLILPTDKEEQQKIAHCLSSLDNLIIAQNKKISAIKTHKKGLITQLFPIEGELNPRIRFREFRDAPNWESESFSKIFTRIIKKNSENNQNVLTISAQKGLISQLDYFNKSVSARDLSGYYLLHKGDFAYNKSYSKGYPMGAIKPLKHYEKGVVSTLYICFRINKGFNESFFEHFFEAGMLNSEIEKIAQEGARNHGLLNISVVDFFNNSKLLIPKTNEEQQKIADCFSSLDNQIEAEVKRLDFLKNHKKGLMQQLFPKINE